MRRVNKNAKKTHKKTLLQNPTDFGLFNNDRDNPAPYKGFQIPILSHALLFNVKFIAFHRGIDQAFEYCDRTAVLHGTILVKRIVMECDPIIFGVLTKNPWKYLYSHYEDINAKTLARLLLCGWSRETIPVALKNAVKREKRFVPYLEASGNSLEKPWNLKDAKTIVKDHYFYEGYPLISTSELLVLGPVNLSWFSRYILFLKQYGLVERDKMAQFERCISFCKKAINA